MKATAPLRAVEHRELIEALEQARDSIRELKPGEQVGNAVKQADHLGSAYSKARYAAERLGVLWIAARFDAGEFSPEQGKLLVKEWVEAAVAQVDAKARTHQVSIETKVEGADPVRGDGELLGAMLANLLSAAIGVSDTGTHLTLSAFPHDSQIVLKLEGRGEALSRKLFPSLVSSESGAGSDGRESGPPLDIGTLMTKPIIEAHKGQLWVESQGENRAALLIGLPPARATAREKVRGQTVLIVDDDPDGAFMLEQSLVKGGYNTVIAHDGLNGLARARSDKPDLVLLDVMLPGIDGFEVCNRLRKDPDTSSLPIIMISAKGRDEDIATGMRMGANDYLTKPLRLAQVLEKVSAILQPADE